LAADAAARSFDSVVMSLPIGRDAATDMAVSVRASPDRGDPDAVAGYRRRRRAKAKLLAYASRVAAVAKVEPLTQTEEVLWRSLRRRASWTSRLRSVPQPGGAYTMAEIAADLLADLIVRTDSAAARTGSARARCRRCPCGFNVHGRPRCQLTPASAAVCGTQEHQNLRLPLRATNTGGRRSGTGRWLTKCPQQPTSGVAP
jgi:hypothetical protein